MPGVYEKLGVKFLYPDNWILDEEDALQGQTSVTVYSPDGAFWSLMIHDRAVDPKDLATTILNTVKQEYTDFEAEPASDTIAGQELRGYDLNFYCLDLTNTGHIRAFRTDNASMAILAQAEDREYKTVEMVFRAITTSLLSNLKK